MGKIIIKGLEIFAYHGVNPEEKENGQKFILDITAYCNLMPACLSDSLADTVSYAKICKTAVRIFTAEKNDLLERAAYRVADGILREYEKIGRVDILLKKPDAPVKADFEYMAAEISLDRGEMQ